MKKILWLLLGLLTALPAYAQTQVYQSGAVTAGNPVMWTSNRFIGDGTLLGGYSSLLVTSTTPTFCINDALTSTAYHQLCLGATNSSSRGVLTYGAFGGASVQPFNLNVTGSSFIVTANSGTATFNGSALTMGVAGSSAGSLLLTGATSGSVTLKTAATAGTFNFILPITAGTTGQPLISGGGGSTPMAWGSLSGNTSTFATTTGSLVTGHCGQFDASGNLVDSGASCANSGVGSGTSGNLPYYATTGTNIVGNANLNISSGALTVGVAASTTGSVSLTGASSGTITIQPSAAAAGTYNYNLPSTAGLSGQVLTSGGGAAAAMTWTYPGIACCTYQNANFNAVQLTGYCIDTTAGAITITLEAAPANGDAILIMDCGNTFGVNNLTVARNGNKIMNLTQNLTVNTTNANFTLQWDTHFSNWIIR